MTSIDKPTTAHRLVAALTAMDNGLSPFGGEEMSRADLGAYATFTTGFLLQVLRHTYGAELPEFLGALGVEVANGKLAEPE